MTADVQRKQQEFEASQSRGGKPPASAPGGEVKAASAEPSTEDQQQSMFNHADTALKGYVSFDDFYKLMKKKDKSSHLDNMLGDDDD